MKQSKADKEVLTFSGVGSSITRKRNVKQELKNLAETSLNVDAIEAALGIKKPKETTTPEFTFVSRIFNPDVEEDRNLLNHILNSPNYKIEYWKDSWMPNGVYKAFVVYGTKTQQKPSNE